jgi:hypothetical protein
MEVSETQKVADVWVLPTRIVKVNAAGPRLMPCIVTMALPMARTLDNEADEMKGRVEEKTPLISPNSDWILIRAGKVPTLPMAITWHLTLESEIHVVVAQLVPPTTAFGETGTDANREPCKVILASMNGKRLNSYGLQSFWTVPGSSSVYLCVMQFTTGTSYDSWLVTLPICDPEVSDVKYARPNPEAKFVKRLLAEIQCVDSDAEPSRIPMLWARGP